MEKIKYYIWLLLVFGAGSAEINTMLGRFSDAEGVYNAFRGNIAAAGARLTEKAESVSLEEAEKTARRITESGTVILTINDRRYPEELKKIPDPPCVLFAQGNIGLLKRRIVGVTGSRAMTSRIQRTIEKTLRGFVGRYTAAGSLTPGCDQMCFLTAVKLGVPFIETAPCGLDYCYPKNGRTLRSFLLRNGGLVLTEFLPWEKPSNPGFIKRARIAAGLSPATIVFQAGINSNSLVTAEKARCPLIVPPADMFRDEYAGNVAAIRNGAPMFFGAEDIERAFSGEAVSRHRTLRKKEPLPEKAPEEEKVTEPKKTLSESDFSSEKHYRIYSIVSESSGAVSDEYIMERTGIDRDSFEEIILDLEISGLISCEPGNRYMRCPG